jgi:hypothetical protein
VQETDSAERIERLARKQSAQAVEVDRSLPGEIGASAVRGALGLAKLVPQVVKIMGSDVAGPVIKGITGRDLAKELTEPAINYLEETSESPAWKPSKEAGGAPIELERIIAHPREVIGQITAQIGNPRFWASQLPEGAMSMIPALVGAWAPRAVAYAGKLGTALEAAKAAGDTAKIAEIGKKLNRLSTIGMYGASMAMEAAQGEEKVRDYELNHPDKLVDWGKRVLSILGTGVVAGSLEAFSLGKIFSGKGGQTLAMKIIDSVATEGLTEGAQSIVENAFAKYGYDPDQKLLEGVVESVLVGAALGGVGGGVESYRLKIRDLSQKAREEQTQQHLATQDLAAAAEGAARGAIYAGIPGLQKVTPPEPVVGAVPERQAPQPMALTPEEQHQAIFGNRFKENLPRADAVRALVPEMGSWERAERFYGLYQQGDAATALQEFPEFSAWATPAQKEVARGLPPAFTGRPGPKPAPMGVTAAEVAERATATPAPVAAEVTSAEKRTTPPFAPMGVAGAAAEDLAAAQHRGKVSGRETVEEALGPIREQQALREQTLDQAGGTVPESRLRRMVIQEVESRLARGEEVDPKVMAKFPELARKYGQEVPAAPPVPETASATVPETVPEEPPTAPPPEPPAPKVVTGGSALAKTERGTEVATSWAVVEANDLVTSHDTALSRNPVYPQELQPRERERAASRLQVDRIREGLEPEFLAESPKASEGAPVIGPDMVVESGNARTIALKGGYETGHVKTQAYKDWLFKNAGRFGLDPEALQQVENPVLVRIRETEVDRPQFVREANEAAVAAMSAVEQAKSDAARMAETDILGLFQPNEKGVILSRENYPFIRRFMEQVVGPTEASRYFTREGELSQEGVTRIRNALFAAAYGDSTALEKLAESPDDAARNVTTALTMVAPKTAVIKAEIRKGNLHDLDISLDLAEAARILQGLREEGKPVEWYLKQGQLFGEQDQLTLDILRLYDHYKRSQTRLTAVLNEYLNLIERLGSPKQGSLLNETASVPTKEELFLTAVSNARGVQGSGGPGPLRADVLQGETGGAGSPEEAGETHPPLTPKKPPKLSLKQAAFGLKSAEKPQGKFEKRLGEVLAAYPDLDPERVSQVLRAQPQAVNQDIAVLSRLNPEEINQVIRGNLSATEREQLFRKATDLGQQKGLPGLGRGGLFGRVGVAPGEAPPLTAEAIQQAFGPEAQVTASPLMPDVHEVLLPNGTRILVKQNAEIKIAPESLTHYGKTELGPEEYAAGEWRSLNGTNLISLAKGEGAETLHHETFHGAMELVLTEKEKAAVLKQYGDEEAAARAYETWNPAEKPDTLFQKIMDFFRRIVEAFRPTAEGTFGKVRSGEVWERQVKTAQTEGDQRLSIRAADAESRLQAYQDKMMAPEGKEPSQWQRFKDRLFLRGDTKQEAADTLKGWYDEIVDRYAPFERAQARTVKAGGLLAPGETPTYTLAFWRGQEGWVSQAVMKNGVYHETKEGGRFTGDNRKVGESLHQRLDPLRELAEAWGEKPQTVINDLFNRFMVAQRDLELAGETGAREAGEIKGVNPDESRQVLADLQQVYGADYAVLEKVAGRLEADGNFTPGSIREWTDQAILERLEQGGLITPELRQEIKAQNQFYLPFKRLMDQVNEYVHAYARALGVKGKVIEEIKGSEKQILDPLQMLMDLAAKANYAYARNRILDSVAKLGEFDPEIYEVKGKLIPGIEKSGVSPLLGLPTKEKTVAFSPLPPEEGTVPYYRDGKLRWLKLPPDMFKATQNMMPEDIGLLLSWAKKPADLLRAGAVTTPEFGLVTNPLRDIVQAWLFSRFGFSPLKWVRDLGLLISKDPATLELRHQAEAGGGFMATLAQSFLEPEKITADDITGKKKGMWYAAHPVQALRHVSAYLENLTRFSIYKQAREKGLSHTEAIHEMRRTTLDFRRTGGHPVVRYLNMIVPFFNASIQGTDKLLSELAGPNRNAVLRRLAMLTAGSIGLWLLAHQDDRYKELENWERNYFWHIPLGKDGPMIRLPKPFEAGIMFGSVPERILDQLVDKNVGGVKSALGAAWQALTPEFIPAFARPLIEGSANYNWFLDRPIEDVSLQALPVELRSKPWTTELAKAVSKYVGPMTSPVMELSPVKVEHLIRTTTGGLGANFFMPGIDVALRKAGVLEDIPQPEQDWIQNVWGVRALFTKPPVGYRAKSVGDFFETYQKTVQADQGWKILWNTGSMDKLDEFLKDNPEAMFARVARKQMAEMGKVKKERNAVHLSKTLSPEQKKTKLDALDEKIVQLVKAGNALMDPGVAIAVGMPSRFKRDAFGGRKSLDLDGYYKFTVESVGDAYEGIQKEIPRLLRMDEASRQRFLIKTIRQAREEYQPLLKKPEDVLKPYRFQNLLDKPTRKERADYQQMFGAHKIPPGAASGYRLKEEKEARP